MTKCEIEYLSADNNPDLPCLTALRMSCNIPVIFERFKYMDSFYIDGGIVNNFPISKGKEIGIKIFGLYSEMSEKSLKDEPEEGIISYFMKLLQIPISYLTKQQLNFIDENCTIIGIDTNDIKNILDFNIKPKNRLDIFSKGYSIVKNKLK
jgi:predicted patatin/cPLA2 family phospholipase